MFDEQGVDLAELRRIMERHGQAWSTILAGNPDPDALVVARHDDGSETRVRAGIRLAQVLHHGTDHRSQVCTALTTLGGIHLVTFAVAVLAGVVVILVRGSGSRVVAIVVAALLWAGGWLLQGREWTTPAGATVSVALLQGAIPQDEKWLAQNRAATLDKYRALNREALGARIIVWPESAIPVLAHDAAPYLAEIRAESAARGSDVLVGLLNFDFESAETISSR